MSSSNELPIPVMGDPSVKPSKSLSLPKDTYHASKEEPVPEEENIHVYEMKLIDIPRRCVNCVKGVCESVSQGDMSPFMDPINHESFLVIAVVIFIISLFFKR